MTVGQVFGVIWMAFFTPIGVLLTRTFQSYKHVQPIKSRVPQYTVYVNFTLIFYSTFICLQRVFSDTYPCFLSLFQGFLSISFISNLYIARCILIYTYFCSTHLNMADITRNRWYAKLFKGLSPPKLAQYGLYATCILMVPALCSIIFDANAREDTGDNCVRHAGLAATLMYLYSSLYLVVFVFITYKIREIYDGFVIKQELLSTGLTMLVTMTLWLLFNYPQFTESINQYFPVSTFILLLGILAIMCINSGWPLYLAWKYKETMRALNQSRDVDKPLKLEDILTSPDGRKSFEEFATAIYVAEEFICWNRIRPILSKLDHHQNVTMELWSQLYDIYDFSLSDEDKMRVSMEVIDREESQHVLESLRKLETALIKKDKADNVINAIRTTCLDISRRCVEYMARHVQEFWAWLTPEERQRLIENAEGKFGLHG